VVWIEWWRAYENIVICMIISISKSEYKIRDSQEKITSVRFRVLLSYPFTNTEKKAKETQ